MPASNGDLTDTYTIEVFGGLPIALPLWLGDDEFSPNLGFLWVETALMY